MGTKFQASAEAHPLHQVISGIKHHALHSEM